MLQRQSISPVYKVISFTVTRPRNSSNVYKAQVDSTIEGSGHTACVLMISLMEYRHLWMYKVLALAAIVCIIVFTSYNLVPNSFHPPAVYSYASDYVDVATLPLCSNAPEARDCLKQRLPKCLILGFAKCGTYALLSFLTLHPDIATAKTEVGFFNNNFNKGLDWYVKKMPYSMESQITIEKTPGYILSTTTLTRIHNFNSSIKLMIIVRDPVTRIPSLYAHNKDDLPTFTKWIKTGEYINRMNYYENIAEAYKLFTKDQILVLCEEYLEESPLDVMKEVEQFLGLRPAFSKELFHFNEDKGFYCFNKSHPRYQAVSKVLKITPETGCFSKAKGREHPEMSPALVKMLATQAEVFNEKLFSLINKRCNWTKP